MSQIICFWLIVLWILNLPWKLILKSCFIVIISQYFGQILPEMSDSLTIQKIYSDNKLNCVCVCDHCVSKSFSSYPTLYFLFKWVFVTYFVANMRLIIISILLVKFSSFRYLYYSIDFPLYITWPRYNQLCKFNDVQIVVMLCYK